jgi:putative endonuclease
MRYVYVLKSQKYKSVKLYFGSTSDLKKRVDQHNMGLSISTKHGIPWKLVYYEAFLSKSDALERENRLKSGSSAVGFLKRRIKQSLVE